MRRSLELVVTTDHEGCAAQLQLFQGAERCGYFGLAQRSEAGWRIMSWKSLTAARQPSERVCEGARRAHEGGLSERFCTFLPAHFSILTWEQDDYRQEFVRYCERRKITKERATSEDALLCLLFWPGWPLWPLTLMKPQPFRLFSWCRGFRRVTEGDRFPSHRTTRVSSSVSCPYLNPQPAFLFCAQVQSQFTQLSVVSDCSKAAWK